MPTLFDRSFDRPESLLYVAVILHSCIMSIEFSLHKYTHVQCMLTILENLGGLIFMSMWKVHVC